VSRRAIERDATRAKRLVVFGEIVGTPLQKMSDGTGEARSRARQHKKNDRRYKMSNPMFLDATKKAIKQRKKNALIHGIYGKDILLPWESRKDFELLLIELQNEFKPDGRTEYDIVFDMAHLRWQKYRLHQMHIAAAYGNPFVADLVNTRKKSWLAMRRHLTSESKTKRTISAGLDEIFLEQAREAVQFLGKAISDGEINKSRIKFDQKRAFIDVIENYLTEALGPRLDAEDLLSRTYSPEYLEPLVRLEAMIDARIDKALARLLSLKEYKRIVAIREPPSLPPAISTPLAPQPDGDD
jgi:hypothetical protein